MNNPDLAEKLKMSNITPSFYNPSETIKKYNHLVITINGEPLIGVGASYDYDTKLEANELIKCDDFIKIISTQYPDSILDIVALHGDNINWKDKEYSISKSKIGVVENGGVLDGDLHWLVFGENALAISTALCISEQIQKIVR